MSNPLVKFLTKTAGSAASSLIAGEIKKHAKGYIEKLTNRSEDSTRWEVRRRLGYDSEQYTVNAKQEVVFKSSAMLMHEWLTKSPDHAGKVTKDEENGAIYYEGAQLSNWFRTDLIAKFQKATGTSSPAAPGHFDKALDLMEVSDFTARQFKEELSGWNHKPVIDTFLQGCFGEGLETNSRYATMLFRKWIVGSARRAMHPGETLDGCLVLQGPAGVGKTQFFRQLLPGSFERRSGEIYADVKSPQRFVEAIVGKTIATFDELSVLDYEKSDEIFKQLLSSQNIDVRMAWARKVRRYALRQGFAGTKNPQKFIRDRFLSRRLWVIQLNASQRLDFEFLHQNKTDLWKEAVYLAENGESCILTPAEQSELETYNQRFWI